MTTPGPPPIPPRHPPTSWPPPPPAPPPGDGRRLRSAGPVLVAVAVLAGLALGAVGAVVVLRDEGSGHPDAWDPRVVELVEFVERERGLTFLHPVHVDFLDDDEFRGEVTARDELTEEEEAEVESVTAMFRALGLVSGEIDLLEVGDTLVGDGVVGFYSYDDERVVVRGTTLDDDATRATLVHELTHALQDQHFDLGGQDHDTSGESAAFTAVVEADAVLVERAWVDTLPTSDREALEASELAELDELDFEGVPEVFVELMSYPYIFGPDFLEAVIDQDGQRGRDAAFTDPPSTERHIVLPETYLAGEQPVEVPTPSLEGGETAVEESEDDFGMLSLLVVLAERVDFSTSWRAVQGWAGDAVVAFERAGTTCVRADVAFEDGEAAGSFASAFGEWSRGVPASHRLDGDMVRFESCDPGTEADLGRSAGHVSAIQGLSIRRALITDMEGSGAPTRTAVCVSDGLLEQLGANRFVEIDELLAADPHDPVRAEVEDVLLDLFVTCP